MRCRTPTWTRWGFCCCDHWIFSLNPNKSQRLLFWDMKQRVSAFMLLWRRNYLWCLCFVTEILLLDGWKRNIVIFWGAQSWVNLHQKNVFQSRLWAFGNDAHQSKNGCWLCFNLVGCNTVASLRPCQGAACRWEVQKRPQTFLRSLPSVRSRSYWRGRRGFGAVPHPSHAGPSTHGSFWYSETVSQRRNLLAAERRQASQ